MAVQGLWNIAGINLPDFGITEGKTTWQANPLAVQSYGAPASYPSTDTGIQSIPGGTSYNLGPNVVKTPATSVTPGTTSGNQTSGESVLGGSDSSGGNAGGGIAQTFAEIDNIYNQMMGYASGLESTAKSQTESMIGDVEKQYAGNQQTLQTEKAAGERGITASETTAGQTKENALAAGRRLYNELQMGGQQKFGGASSAGQAYSELTGREFQRGQATTQQAYQNAMTKIMDMKQTLQERFDTSMNNLMIQKDNAISEVRRAFQSKLDEINSIKTEAGINKSTQRLELLQNLRNNIYQINLAAAQTQAQLAVQKQQQEAENNRLTELLQTQATGLTQNQNTLSSVATSNPTTSLAMTQGGMGATQPYVGSIKKDEEMVTGVRNPKDYLFA